MGDFCFSIDEERYDDRHGHVLKNVWTDGIHILTEKHMDFELLGRWL